jgi:DNA-binding response OmpR family regulator
MPANLKQLLESTEKRLRVLVVEDSESDFILIREHLGDSPFDIVGAASLAEGISHIRKGGFDAILLDLALPDGIGLDTFDKMYAEADPVPIVVLCGLDNDLVALSAVQRGAQDYLVKGNINSDWLERAIHYAIERKRIDRLELQVMEEIFKAAPFPAARLDKELTITATNPEFNNQFKAESRELVGLNIGFLFPALSKDALTDVIKRAISFRAEDCAAEPFLQRCSARWNLTIWPVLDKHDTALGAVFTARKSEERTPT